MIKDYKFIACMRATNLVESNFYPLSKICIESLSKAEYVDEILLLDTGSIDKTVDFHKDIPKVKFMNPPLVKGLHYAKPGTWSSYCNFLFDNHSTINKDKNKTLIYFMDSNMFFDKEIILELYEKCKIFIDSDRDTFNVNWRKSPCKNLIEINDRAVYFSGRISMQSHIIKSTPELHWKAIDCPRPGEGNRIMYIGNENYCKQINFKWEKYAILYHNWLQTKEQLIEKNKLHHEWNIETGILEEIIDRIILHKSCNVIGSKNINDSELPIEIQKQILPYLNENHLGYSLFGCLPNINGE